MDSFCTERSGRPFNLIRGRDTQPTLLHLPACPAPPFMVSGIPLIDTLPLQTLYLSRPPYQAVWKPKPVSLNIPPHTKPVLIQLEGTPLLRGQLALTGCRLTAFGGVTWVQPWSRRPAPPALQALGGGLGAGGGGTAPPEARVTVVDRLPRAELALAAHTRFAAQVRIAGGRAGGRRGIGYLLAAPGGAVGVQGGD